MINNVSLNEFDEQIKSGFVLVDFYANWCGPCKMQSPILEEFSKTRPNLIILKVDVDKEQELASRFNVMSIPTLILFKDGVIESTKVGFNSIDVLSNWIN